MRICIRSSGRGVENRDLDRINVVIRKLQCYIVVFDNINRNANIGKDFKTLGMILGFQFWILKNGFCVLVGVVIILDR